MQQVAGSEQPGTGKGGRGKGGPRFGQACFEKGIAVDDRRLLPLAPPGYFTRRGDTSARPCEDGFFSTGGASQCTPCGERLTTIGNGTTSADDCVCRFGFFDTGGDGRLTLAELREAFAAAYPRACAMRTVNTTVGTANTMRAADAGAGSSGSGIGSIQVLLETAWGLRFDNAGNDISSIQGRLWTAWGIRFESPGREGK